MSYYPDSKVADSLEVGAQFVDFVMEAMARRNMILQPYQSRKKQYETGETLQGWEVKLDSRYTDTKRLSIEIAEKSARHIAVWTPSGIYRRDNTWLYIQGNYNGFFVFMKKILVLLHNSRQHNYKVEEYNGTVRKFYLPIDDAMKYGEFIKP